MGSALTGNTTADNTGVAGTTYYYVVSAQNEYGEGANSAEVSATPTLGPVDAPVISYDAGLHTVKLSEAIPGAIIHYTLDGSEPTEGSPVYKGLFPILTTTTIKAKA